MNRLVPAALSILLLLAACQSAPPETPVLPTQFVLPTVTPTDTLIPTPTETRAPTLTFTPSSTPTPSDTPPPSSTPTETLIPSVTPNTTRVAAITETAVSQQRPVFSTLTPVPPGVPAVPTTTPQVLAAVVITEQQFQTALNERIKDLPNVQNAQVNFVAAQGDTPGGISITLTAVGADNAFTTGMLFIPIPKTYGAVALQGQLTFAADDPPPSDEFIAFATGDFFITVVQTLDSILKSRLGNDQTLQSITVTNQAMELSLLVPKP